MTNERPLKKGHTIVGEFLIQDIFGGEGKSGMGVVYLVTSRKFDRPFVFFGLHLLQCIPMKEKTKKQ